VFSLRPQKGPLALFYQMSEFSRDPRLIQIVSVAHTLKFAETFHNPCNRTYTSVCINLLLFASSLHILFRHSPSQGHACFAHTLKFENHRQAPFSITSLLAPTQKSWSDPWSPLYDPYRSFRRWIQLAGTRSGRGAYDRQCAAGPFRPFCWTGNRGKHAPDTFEDKSIVKCCATSDRGKYRHKTINTHGKTAHTHRTTIDRGKSRRFRPAARSL